MVRRRITAAAMVTALLVSLAACGGDDDPAERVQPPITTPTTQPTSSSSTAATEPDAEADRVEAEPPPDEPRPDIDVNVTYPADFTEEQAAVVAAYRGYWHAAYAMNDPCGPTQPGQPAECLPEPDQSAVGDYAAGERLVSVRATAAENRTAGKVIVIPDGAEYRHTVLEVAVDGGTATVSTCALDDAVVLEASTGRVVDDSVITRRYVVTLRLEGGRWKVTGGQLLELRRWDGEEMQACMSED